MRLQALVDKKKVAILEATIKDALRLEARMGYEKPLTKLTFYKAFFLSQWKNTTFEGMIVEQQVDEGNAKMNVKDLSTAGVAAEGNVSAADDVVPTADAEISINLLQNLMDTCTTLTRRVEHLEHDKIDQALEITKLKQRERIIADMDADVDVIMKDAKEVVLEKSADVDESVDVQGRKAESQAQIYQIDLEHDNKVLSMQDDEVEPVELQELIEVVTTAKLITEVVTTTNEAYARELEVELNKNIDWDEVIDHVQRKQKEDNVVKRYQALKRKPHTEAQDRKIMMIYLRNVVGFKIDYFKGMTYDDIRPIFEKHFDSNVAFLQKTKEQMDEEDSRALKRLNEMPNDEDDVYTEATPLACKVPVVDYEIYNENNKPYYKIKRADGTKGYIGGYVLGTHDEDPEEDPVDYPANGGDNGDDEEESSEDDEDNGMDIEADEEEEEEHPAPADSVVVAPTTADQAPSAKETEPFETDESAATPPPHPAYCTIVRISIPAPVPMPAWTNSEVVRLLAISSPPASPLSPSSSPPPQIPFPPLPRYYHHLHLYYHQHHLLALFLPFASRREDRPEVTLPPRKRLDIALGPRYEVGESSSATAARPAGGHRADYGFVATVDREIGAPVSTDTKLGGYVREFETRVRQDTDEIYMRLDDEQTERQLLAGQLNILFRDRRAHAYTCHLMETEARMSREAWVRATDASDHVHGEVMSLRTTMLGQMSEIRKLQGQVTALQAQVTTLQGHQGLAGSPTQSGLPEEAGGVTAALAARDALRSTNGGDSHNSGTGVRRTERAIRECTYTDFLKCQPLPFKGTEGVASLSEWCERMESVFYISNCAAENQVKFATYTLHSVALTWWNTHVQTIGHEATYGLPDMIHGSVVALKPKTMQEAIEIATELMDKKILTFVERETASKRKFENTSRNT
nr:hypothetical protein [Tanacetum cinerariifolium]